MSTSQKLISLDAAFRQLTDPPIILNDLPRRTQADRDVIRDLTVTSYTEDLISLLPRCRCGAIKGAVHTTRRTICGDCGTMVKAEVLTEIEANIWFRRPGTFDEFGEFTPTVQRLINPMVLIMLRDQFKKSSFVVVDWLINRDYRLPEKRPAVLNKLEALWPNRGYNFFVENFWEIIDVLFSIRDFINPKDTRPQKLRELLHRHADLLFSDYLPLPNRTLRIIEKNAMGTYVEKNVLAAIDTLELMTSIDRDHWDRSPAVKENRTGKALIMLAEYYSRYFAVVVDSTKKGQMRRNIMGARSPYANRGVISSITGHHDLNETYMPWGVGVTLFQDHLLNYLFKEGKTLNQSLELLYGSVNRYNDTVARMLDRLVADHPDNHFTFIGQRNPSLLQSSALKFRVPGFKMNPRDRTIGLPILDCAHLNADKRLKSKSPLPVMVIE